MNKLEKELLLKLAVWVDNIEANLTKKGLSWGVSFDRVGVREIIAKLQEVK